MSDMCLVLASHNGHGWEGWVGGPLPCMPYSLWQGKDSGDGCELWKVFIYFVTLSCLERDIHLCSGYFYNYIHICSSFFLHIFPADWRLKSTWRKRWNHRKQRPNRPKGGSSSAVCGWFKGTLYTLLGCLWIWQMKKYLPSPSPPPRLPLSLSHTPTHPPTTEREGDMQ